MLKMGYAVFLQDVHIPGVPDYKNYIDPDKFKVDLFFDRDGGVVWAVSRNPNAVPRARFYSVNLVREGLPLELPPALAKQIERSSSPETPEAKKGAAPRVVA